MSACQCACQEKHTCPACGYDYDPAKGDFVNEVSPGTSFEHLPRDYSCPVCGISKDKFEIRVNTG